MIIHLDDLAIAVKRHTGEHEVRGNVLDAYVLDYINRAWEMVYGTILSLRDDFFSTYYDISLDGSREYDLPLGVNRLFAVEDITGGASDPIDTSPIRFEERFFYFWKLPAFRYYLRSGVFGVPSGMSGKTMRLWYPGRPRRLWVGVPTAVTSTTLTFTNGAAMGTIVPEDDYYNGMFFVTQDGQVREITGGVGSTSVFTIGSAWATNPLVASARVSLAAPISQYQFLISLRAGILWRTDLDMDIRELTVQYREGEKPLLQLLAKKQTHKSQHVKKVPR